MNAAAFVLAGALALATPLILAALGELIAEKSGVLNLGIEGMMALSAASAFIATYRSDSFLLGFAAGGLGGLLLSTIFAILVVILLANQVAAGLAVSILGLGLSALLGRQYEGMTILPLDKITVQYLSHIPFFGPLGFHQDAVVYFALAAGAAIGWFLNRTRAGLVVRVTGENPYSAHAVGLSPIRVRFLAVLFGGVMAGFAGAYSSIVLTPLWSQGMIAGRGWIAVALVVFGSWRPGRIMLGAYLFGAAQLANVAIQSFGAAIPSSILTCLPYVLTIVTLAAVSSDRTRVLLSAPVSLGENYRSAG
jgi:simple sugar transport system permease protein